MSRKLVAECIGTFWLVLGGCGSAVLAAGFPDLGIGFVGVALAFGLTVLTMAYAIGHVSGCHLNPAVTCGLVAAGRFRAAEAVPYILAQVIGATIGALLIWAIASGQPGFDLAAKGLATNGYGAASPGQFNLTAGFLTEAVLTALFLLVILGSTAVAAPPGFAPIAIGLCLTLIHLISIPVTNTSVNPARSTGPAIVMGGIALQQLWLFWVAPIIGAVCAGLLHRWLSAEAEEDDFDLVNAVEAAKLASPEPLAPMTAREPR
ncbi:aquaporin Z [Siccirubricoccus phaeus]|uniref:aquaporin Z n=1 Tax=Siccirubricoccus phaeus TaxID=2595053 RepID=UPI0011F3BEC5|nr:aquaporin Z [Siccirubricoccus phaeus]